MDFSGSPIDILSSGQVGVVVLLQLNNGQNCRLLIPFSIVVSHPSDYPNAGGLRSIFPLSKVQNPIFEPA